MDTDYVTQKVGDLVELEPDEIALADTIGHASPRSVEKLCRQLTTRWQNLAFAMHLHDTQALGLTNAWAAMNEGVRIFDTSFGGLGGCPFAPGAKGNLATEDLVTLAEKGGFTTGIDLKKLFETIRNFSSTLGRPLGGRTQSWWNSQFKPGGSDGTK